MDNSSGVNGSSVDYETKPYKDVGTGADQLVSKSRNCHLALTAMLEMTDTTCQHPECPARVLPVAFTRMSFCKPIAAQIYNTLASMESTALESLWIPRLENIMTNLKRSLSLNANRSNTPCNLPSLHSISPVYCSTVREHLSSFTTSSWQGSGEVRKSMQLTFYFPECHWCKYDTDPGRHTCFKSIAD